MKTRLLLIAAHILLASSSTLFAQNTQPSGGGAPPSPSSSTTQSSSTTSGATNVQVGAGSVEASALTAMVVNKIAGRIAKNLPKSPPFLIVTGNTMPDFSGWLMLDVRITYLANQFADGEAAFNKAYSVNVAFRDILPPGMTSAVKLAQLFATDWTAGGITMQPDDYLLAVAIASASDNALIYNQASLFSVDEAVKRRFSSLDKARQQASSDAVLASEQSSHLKDNAKTDKTQADQYNKKAAALDSAAAKLNAATSSYDALVAQLAGASTSPPSPSAPVPSSPAPTTTPPTPAASAPAPASAPSVSSSLTLASILQQKAGYDVAKAGGVLFVKMHSDGGAFYTKKNIWSALGAMPFYVSGGVVVSYSYVNGDSRKAGVLEMVVPYARVGNVERIIDLCAVSSDVSKSSEYQEYCQ